MSPDTSRNTVYEAEAFGQFAPARPDSFYVELSPPGGKRKETSRPLPPDGTPQQLWIRQQGQVRCLAQSERGSFTLEIDQPKKDVIERIRYSVFSGGDVLLLYQFGDIESSATSVARVSSDCSLTWTARLSGFNPGPPLIHERSVYATVIGRVARINAESGAIIWMHDDLYQRDTGTFNSFQQPRMFEDIVFFPDKRDPDQRIIVARETGELISFPDS